MPCLFLSWNLDLVLDFLYLQCILVSKSFQVSPLSIHSVLFIGHLLREGCYVPTSKIASPHVILWLLPLDSYNLQRLKEEFSLLFLCLVLPVPTLGSFPEKQPEPSFPKCKFHYVIPSLNPTVRTLDHLQQLQAPLVTGSCERSNSTFPVN